MMWNQEGRYLMGQFSSVDISKKLIMIKELIIIRLDPNMIPQTFFGAKDLPGNFYFYTGEM